MLPRPVPHFTGRSAELARILEHAGNYSVIVIEGPPGSGKTALALELANRHYPDARWLPAAPCETLLHQLGDTDTQLSKTERLRRLAGRPGLHLFLDDWHEMEDGLELLTTMRDYLKDGLCVLTTRVRPALPPPSDLDVLEVRLGALAEAAELLHKLDEQDHTILQLAAGHPLTLKLLVSLRRQGRRTTSDVYENLFLLLQSLSPEQREGLEQRALLEPPLPERLPEAPELQARFLLEPPQGTVHDVFREAILQKLSSERKKELHRQCAELYSGERSLAARQRAMLHHFEAGQLEQARALLLSAQRELFLTGQYDFLLDWNARWPEDARLGITRADVYALRGQTRTALDLLEQAEQNGNPDEAVQAINSRSHLLLEQGDLEAAVEVAQFALSHLEARGESDSHPGWAKAYNALALAAARRGQAAQAREWAEKSIATGDLRGRAYGFYAIALSWLAEESRTGEILQACRQASEACRACGEHRLLWLIRFVESLVDPPAEIPEPLSFEDPVAEAMHEAARAESLRAQGRWEEAADCGRKAVAKASLHGGKVFLAQLLIRLAKSLERLHQPAHAHLERASQLAIAAGALPLLEQLRAAWTFYPKQNKLEIGDKQLKLRPILSKLLQALVKAHPQPKKQQDLYLEVWGPPFHPGESDGQVRKSISALRDLLEPDRANPRYVLATQNGYLLQGEFRVIRDQE